MKNKIKKILNKIMYPNTYSSAAFVKYLREKGCRIGDGTYFYDPKNTVIDSNRLKFIEIGENCQITRGVTILGHDFSYSVLQKDYKCMLEKSDITKIGNNVFLGLKSIIMMGTEIGDNVIIGAGAVVSGKIPSNTVWAGNPARQICTMEEYYNKLVRKFESNAKLHAKRIIEITGKNPTIKEMEYYCILFLEKNETNKELYFKHLNYKGNDKEQMISNLMKIEPKYKSYEDFLNNL